MKVLIPENTFLWTPKGLIFPKNIFEGSEIFLIDSKNDLIPFMIQNEINSEEIQVTTIITNVTTLTVPQEYSINILDKKTKISELETNLEITYVDEEILEKFKKYFIDHIDDFSQVFFDVITARNMGKSYFHEQKNLPYKIPNDPENEKEAWDIAKQLQEQYGKKVFVKFSGNLSGYGKSTLEPWKIFIEEKNYLRIRKEINSTSDKISMDIYSSGLNSFLHFHKIAITEGVPAYFDYELRNRQDPYIIMKMPWDSKFRKIFQNGCIFEKKNQLRLYDSRINRSNSEVKNEIADSKGILSPQKILDIKHHNQMCYEITIPLGTKIVLDNHLISPVEVDLENRVEFEDEISNFEPIRREIISKFTEFDQPVPKTIEKIRSQNQEHFCLIGKIIANKPPKHTRTRFGNKILFEGVLEDETDETKFSVWTTKDLEKSKYDGMYLYIPFATTKNGIVTNEFNKEIIILDELLNEDY